MKGTHVFPFCFRSIKAEDVSPFMRFPQLPLGQQLGLAPPYNYDNATLCVRSNLEQMLVFIHYGEGLSKLYSIYDQLIYDILCDAWPCVVLTPEMTFITSDVIRQNVTFPNHPPFNIFRFCKWHSCAHATEAKIESRDQVQLGNLNVPLVSK